MRALAEAHARDPDANARAMPPPLEIALVVNAFLRARAGERRERVGCGL
jgi:hypothetical protein